MRLFRKSERAVPSPAAGIEQKIAERRHLEQIAALRFVNDHVAMPRDLRPGTGLVRSAHSLTHVI